MPSTTASPDQAVLPPRIERASAVPIYYQIQRHFQHLIEEGRLRPGEPLPPESVLARRLGISKMTVRQAMRELEIAGLITRSRGRGTFVAFPRMRHELRRLTGFTEDVSARGMVPGARLLFFGEVPAPGEVAQPLGLRPGEPVLRIRRLRLADGKPAALHDSYLRGVRVDRQALEERGSLYALLEDQGVHLAEADETIEAVAATRHEARWLAVTVGAPLLLVSRTVYTPDGQPVEFVRALYRADFYRYSVRLRRA
jgi:GntR family transcriptional regulator